LSGDEELRFKCPPKFRSIYMDILAAPEGDFSSDRGRNPIIKIDPLPEFGQNLLPNWCGDTAYLKASFKVTVTVRFASHTRSGTPRCDIGRNLETAAPPARKPRAARIKMRS
jgi:hypothetical protein